MQGTAKFPRKKSIGDEQCTDSSNCLSNKVIKRVQAEQMNEYYGVDHVFMLGAMEKIYI